MMCIHSCWNMTMDIIKQWVKHIKVAYDIWVRNNQSQRSTSKWSRTNILDLKCNQLSLKTIADRRRYVPLIVYSNAQMSTTFACLLFEYHGDDDLSQPPNYQHDNPVWAHFKFQRYSFLGNRFTYHVAWVS